MFKKKGVIIKGVIIIGLLVGGWIYFFTASPFFPLREIEISHPGFINKETLSEWGLQKGRNILLIKLEAVREKIEALPEVKEAVVKKELPYRVIIEIEKHKPFLILKEDRNIAVSRDGVIFPFKEKERNDFHYPLLLYKEGGLIIGKSFPVLKKAVEAYVAVERIGVAVDVITVKKDGNIVLRTEKTETEIRMGKEDFSRRARYLEIVMEELNLRNVEYIDLRFGRDVVVKGR